LITETQLQGLLDQVEHILGKLSVDDSEQDVTSLQSLNALSLEKLMQWNSLAPMVSPGTCLHHLFEDMVMKQPLRPAIRGWDADFTYKELDETARDLSRKLVSMGVGPQTLVPLAFEKSSWAVVSMIAVLKAGGAFVPLDVNCPLSRKSDILDQTGATIVLSSAEDVNKWDSFTNVQVLAVDQHATIGYTGAEILSDDDSAALNTAEPGPSDTAYLIFTSGSTGRPKGVVIEHSMASAGASGHGSVLKFGPDTRALQFSSYAFDASIMEIFATLTYGGCVCVPSDGDRTPDIVTVMEQMRVNWALFTPSFLKTINPGDVPHLKTLVVGGESCTDECVETWAPKVEMIQAYGPAEATVISAAMTIDPGSTTAYTIGAIGELVIQGPIVARGYIGEPEKTREAFINSPNWLSGLYEGESARIYKTGDLVRHNPDGSICFVGRKDRQVKVRGQRVELGEIEHVLSTCAGSRHSMILFPKAGECKGKLVAVISASLLASTSNSPEAIQLASLNDESITTQDLKTMQSQISEQLPSYMIPEVWAMVADVPLTPSMKIDRRIVTQWIEGLNRETYTRILKQAKTGKEDVAAKTAVEVSLQKVWSQVLNLPIEIVGTQNSFLSLGGDSITAMQVVTKSRAEGISVNMQNVLRSRTLTQLAAGAKGASVAPLVAAMIEDTTEPFALSPIQSLYFSHIASQGTHHFNQSFLLRLENRTSPKELRRAVDAIVSRHAMLRSRFQRQANEAWTQRIETFTSASYRFHSYEVASKDEMAAIARDTTTALSVDGPVFAADVFYAGNSDYVFLVAHHLVIDLVSWRVILANLEEFLSEGSIASAESISFRSWTNLQASFGRESDDMLPQKALPFTVPQIDYNYWGMEDKANSYGDVTSIGFMLDAATTTSLLGPCHDALRTEPIDIFLSSIMHSFRRIFKDRDTPAIFNEGHGRESWDPVIDITETVGWFTTIYPIYADVSTDDVVDTVRLIKGVRRSIPQNGWPYFASRFLNDKGRQAFGQHDRVEMMFNYAGLYQQLERQDTLLHREVWDEADDVPEISDQTKRISLFEIGASIENGRARMTFVFNRNMRHIDKIEAWVKECEVVLRDSVHGIEMMEPEFTQTDVPLLDLTLEELRTFNRETVPSIGSFADIEDAYPLSPMQHGIVMSQAKNATNYKCHFSWKVTTSHNNGIVDSERLEAAWRQVVGRHSTLRTVFVKSASTKRLTDQIVLSNYLPSVAQILVNDEAEAFECCEKGTGETADSLHQLTICTTKDQKAFIRLDIDHGLIDGGSLGPLLSDFVKAYDGALLEGTGPQYRDYVDYIQRRPMENSILHWKQYLSGAEPCSLPNLSDIGSSENSLVTIDVDFQIPVKSIIDFCTAHEVTISNFFQVAWALLLRTYTGTEDILFGYLTSGRETPVEGIEDAIGLFANMMVCRFRVQGEVPLLELLQEAQRGFLQNLDHQYCSLAHVQHDLGMAGKSLFNTGISFQRLPCASGEGSSSLNFEHLSGQDSTEYDLIVNVAANNDTVGAALSFWTAQVSESNGAHIASCFAQIVSEIVANVSGTVATLDPLSSHDINTIYETLALEPIADDACVHELFTLAASRQPSKIAIDSWDGSISYGTLDHNSSQLAAYLRLAGVGPEDIIPICFEKSIWAVVAMLAVMKAGAAWTPIDHSHPKARHEEILGQVDARYVLTSANRSDLWDGFPNVRAIVVESATFSSLPTSTDSTALIKSPSRLRNAAYVLFTSGSTGTPKGVIIENVSFTTSILEQGRVLQMNCDTRTLQFTSYTFDPSLVEIFSTLLCGGCVCTPTESARMGDITNIINDMKITWTSLTPSFLRTINPDAVPTLKSVIVGGERMPSDVFKSWREGDRQLIQVYGPTEATITCMVSYVPASGPAHPANIGRALASRAWVVNAVDHNMLLPVGAVGELLIEGPILARGYLGDVSKTSSVFIEDPVWAKKHFSHLESTGASPRRFYKTGDLVRLSPSGEVLFLGRKGTQVKIRGQRVELGEIENSAKIHLATSHVVVEVVAHPINNNEALAIFILQSDENNTAHEDNEANLAVSTSEHIITHVTDNMRGKLVELEQHLSQSLPSYMVPSLFVPVDCFPMTVSGKTDRKRLREMPMSENHLLLALRDGGVVQKRPLAGTELLLRALWTHALNIPQERIFADDNFFRLGGDSINAIKLVGAAREAGFALEVFHIFQNPTLAKMAVVLVGTQRATKQELIPFSMVDDESSLVQDAVSECRIGADNIEDIFPATPLQEGIMALSARQSGAYFLQMVFRVPDTVESERLIDAWNSITAATDILRTRMIISGSKTYQVVTRSPADWTHGTNLSNYLNADSTNLPGAAYHGKPIVVQTPYKSFIHYLHQGTITADASKKFWETSVAGISCPTFPQLPSATYQPLASSTAHHTTFIGGADARSSAVVISTSIRAAWAKVVSKYTYSDEAVFGVTLSGRDAPVDGISGIIGPTITTVPFRVKMVSGSTVGDYLESVQKHSDDMSQHIHFGIQNIKKLGPDGTSSCDFQTLLVIQFDQQIEKEFEELLEPMEADNSKFETFALTIEFRVTDNSVAAEARFDPEVIKPEQMQRMLQQFGHVLRQLVQSDPAQSIKKIGLLSPEDCKKLTSWHREPETWPSLPSSMHDAFQQQVIFAPSAPAISSWDGDFTYEELDNCSSILATQLRHLGVGSDTIVPVCFEKSAWAIVSMMGILKAGAAFVPLDAAHPRARLLEIIGQVGAQLILTAEDLLSKWDFEDAIVLKFLTVNRATIDAMASADLEESVVPVIPPKAKAYILFTSGSTGKPKGVIMEHGALLSSLSTNGKAMKMSRQTRTIQFASYTFDACIMEIFGALYYGGCICVPSENARMGNLAQTMTDLRANWAFFTPSFVRLLKPKDVPTLETLVLGGEAVTQEALSTWAGHVSLFGGYGPTETCIFCCVEELTPTTDPTSLGVSVSERVWVADAADHDQLVPIGAIGELLVQGPTLSSGYLKNPDKTAEVFIESPVWLASFSSDLLPRMYKTGDLVRYTTGGKLQYLGRKDTQVKVRGQRIELGEIEHQATSLTGGINVVADVVKHPNRSTAPSVALFLVLDPESQSEAILMPPSEESQSQLKRLQAALLKVLPSYMVPTLFIPINRMPFTTAGKTDRLSLRRLIAEVTEEEFLLYSLGDESAKLATSTPMEATLARLWAVVLKTNVASIGADHSFFRIGGDSILAIELSSLARGEGLSVEVPTVFQHPVLSELALHVERIDGDPASLPSKIEPFSLTDGSHAVIEQAANACGVDKHHIEDVYPCTALQEGLMALSIKTPGSYVLHNSFALPEDIDLHRLEAAWRATHEQMPILRTRIFQTEEQGVLQVVIAGGFHWTTVLDKDVSDFVSQDRQRAVRYGDTLCRLTVLCHPDGHKSLIWNIHHALYDGWCLPLILTNMEAHYQGLESPTPIPFNHFIKYLTTNDTEASETFWASTFDGFAGPSFPALPSATYSPRADDIVDRHIEFQQSRLQSDITDSTFIRAALGIVIARHTNSRESAFGITLTGRNAPISGILTLPGPTITTIPFKAAWEQDTNVSAFLHSVQSQATDMIPCEQLGLQRIRRLTTHCRAACDFQTLLVIQPVGQEERVSGGSIMGKMSVLTDSKEFQTYGLTIECILGSEGMIMHAQYDSAMLSRTEVQRLMEQIDQVINQLQTQVLTDQLVEDITVITPGEVEQLVRWNGPMPAAVDQCLHQTFATQAKIRPLAPAVNGFDGDFTYAELDHLSSVLAHRLQLKGVGSGQFVPFCFHKSAWMPVAAMAILKAGAACVAIDPTHPIGRLQTIIGEVKATMVLTSAGEKDIFRGIFEDDMIVTPELLSADMSNQPTPTLSPVNPEDPAFVVFTSGSTGKPKGIILSHRSISTSSAAHGQILGIGPGSRVLQFSAYTFDISIQDVFTTLARGGCVCVISYSDRVNNLAGAINSLSVNFAGLTPTVASLLYPGDVPTLRTLALAGEALTKSNIETWHAEVDLHNCYGPAETAIYCSSNGPLKGSDAHGTIGRPLASRLWVVEADDHNKLVPIGCAGELLVEGPQVGKGYLNEPEKTAAAFIENPAWAQPEDGSARRMYKTGDIVFQNKDGTFVFVSRKDSQVKIRGQRVEIDEIVSVLLNESGVEQAAVVIPKTGFCNKSLVAIVCPSQSMAVESETDMLEMSQDFDAARTLVSQLRKRASDSLPSYMVPEAWLVVNDIPKTTSMKVDRKRISQFMEEVDEETYRKMMDLAVDDLSEFRPPVTSMEIALHDILQKVLNTTPDLIDMSRSFLASGGDSITAMQTVSSARGRDLILRVEDILLAKDLSELALTMTMILPQDGIIDSQERPDASFLLSPTQELFFSNTLKDDIRFNENVLRLGIDVPESDLRDVLDALVRHQPMLRARFDHESDPRTQRITTNVEGSYRYSVHSISSPSEMEAIITTTRSCLSSSLGPLFAADLIDIGNDGRYVFMTAHFLVMDSSSWSIVLDEIKHFLQFKRLRNQDAPLPYEHWCRSLSIEQQDPQDVRPTGDLSYWGVSENQDVFDPQLHTGFSVDAERTEVLRFISKKMTGVDPTVVFLTAITYAFRTTFADRAPPSLWLHIDARNDVDVLQDFSNTVGSFTDWCNLDIVLAGAGDAIDALASTKQARLEQRSRTVNRGFASQLPFEITFTCDDVRTISHRGQAHDILQKVPDNQLSMVSLAESARLPGLINISATLGESDGAKLDFAFPGSMSRTSKFNDWVSATEAALLQLIDHLENLQPQIGSNQGYPVCHGHSAQQMISTGSSSPIDVEDIYPCSPLQQDMLLSEEKQRGYYNAHFIFKIGDSERVPIDTTKLEHAWHQVVDRHRILRTVFFKDSSRGDLFTQVVLKTIPSTASTITIPQGKDAEEHLASLPRVDARGFRPSHKFTLCATDDGKTLASLHINHTIMDGPTISTIIADLSHAYHGLGPSSPLPVYRDFISHVQHSPLTLSLKYWRNYLTNAPNPATSSPFTNPKCAARSGKPQTVSLPVTQIVDLETLARNAKTTLASVFRAAWALLLHQYTGSDVVVFGYVTAGRQVPVAGADHMAGPLLNMLPCRTSLDAASASAVPDLLRGVHEDYLDSMAHGLVSPAQIGRSLARAPPLFNTLLNFRRHGTSTKEGVESVGLTAEPDLSYEMVYSRDPMEFDIVVAIDDKGRETVASISYWDQSMTRADAERVAEDYHLSLSRIVSSMGISSLA
ncbi:hypothetical protein EsH8_XIII_000001, partial [Colletotrichum jinshuiense]